MEPETNLVMSDEDEASEKLSRMRVPCLIPKVPPIAGINLAEPCGGAHAVVRGIMRALACEVGRRGAHPDAVGPVRHDRRAGGRQLLAGGPTALADQGDRAHPWS